MRLARAKPALAALLAALLAGAMLLPVTSTAIPFAQCPNGTVTLLSGQARACAEVAATEPERERGLMWRISLPADGGMLFVFPFNDLHQMWMKNTEVALSVAFIDERGVIINIEDMQPQTLTAHAAQRPARYALEMAQGWFGRRNLAAGARIDGLPPASQGR